MIHLPGYLVQEHLGVGGFGTVFKAERISDKQVCISFQPVPLLPLTAHPGLRSQSLDRNDNFACSWLVPE
jgi:hypothetical protein